MIQQTQQIIRKQREMQIMLAVEVMENIEDIPTEADQSGDDTRLVEHTTIQSLKRIEEIVRVLLAALITIRFSKRMHF